jgi:hypothetical protein
MVNVLLGTIADEKEVVHDLVSSCFMNSSGFGVTNHPTSIQEEAQIHLSACVMNAMRRGRDAFDMMIDE